VTTTERTYQTSPIAPAPGRVGPGERRVNAHLGYRVHAPQRWFHLHLTKLWTHRHLIRHFGVTYVMRRFRGMYFGWLWLPLRPGVQLLQRGLVFGAMLKVGSGNRPYIIFLLVGQAAWDFYDRSVFFGLRSIGRQGELRKVDLPWITVVAGTLIPGALDALVYVVVAVFCCGYYELTQGSFYINFGPELLGLVPGVALLSAWAVATTALTAPLVYKVPDTRFLIRYVFTFLIYLTPVMYPTSSLQGYSALARYNPLTAPIEMIKNALLSTGAPSAASMTSTVIGLLIVAPAGLLFVSWAQRSAAREL
jgi:lipopolysaccharide transport system permease protein